MTTIKKSACFRLIHLDNKPKTLRRAKIREELEDFDAAIFDYKKVMDID